MRSEVEKPLIPTILHIWNMINWGSAAKPLSRVSTANDIDSAFLAFHNMT
jgi:hypothetical protein